MLIGIDGLPLTTPKTGVGHYTFELALALAQFHPSDCFELAYPSTSPPVTNIGNVGKPLPGNLKLERVRVGPWGRHWWSTGLPRYIRRKGIDLFHGTNYDVPLWRSCATVLTIHDLSQHLYPDTHTRRSVARARRRLPMMARLANAIITPSENAKREVCKHLKAAQDKVFAVPEAARTTFWPLAFEATAGLRQKLGVGDDFLLAVGTIEPRKNLALLVTAFNQVAGELAQRNLQLVMAGGRGWLSGPVFDAIEKSEVRQRIVLTDYLQDEELRALYSSCRAFVYPSIYEGFGLPPLEAMACGAPVIASNIPAIAETTGGAARLFDPKDVDDIARTITELLNDEHARHELSLAGQRRAAEFSWEQTAQQTLRVYQEALRRYRG